MFALGSALAAPFATFLAIGVFAFEPVLVSILICAPIAVGLPTIAIRCGRWVVCDRRKFGSESLAKVAIGLGWASLAISLLEVVVLLPLCIHAEALQQESLYRQRAVDRVAQIVNACQNYESVEGKLPASLELLVQTKLLRAEQLYVDAEGLTHIRKMAVAAPAREPVRGVEIVGDFIYMGAGGVSVGASPERLMTLCTRRTFNDGKLVIGFALPSFEAAIPPAELEAVLTASNAERTKLGLAPVEFVDLRRLIAE